MQHGAGDMICDIDFIIYVPAPFPCILHIRRVLKHTIHCSKRTKDEVVPGSSHKLLSSAPLNKERIRTAMKAQLNMNGIMWHKELAFFISHDRLQTQIRLCWTFTPQQLHVQRYIHIYSIHTGRRHQCQHKQLGYICKLQNTTT